MVRMLVTRPEPDAGETAARLGALGIEAVAEPLLKIEMLPASLPDAEGFAGVVLSSGNALRALEARGAIGAYRHLRAFAVGDRTAAAAAAFGFADVVSAGGNAENLVTTVVATGLKGPLFYPAARERTGNLGKALARHGVMMITTPIYAMNPAKTFSGPAKAALETGRIDAGLFFSRRTAETFVTLAQSIAGLEMLELLCLSEAVAAPLLKAHFVRVSLADYPSEEAMLALALSFARGQKRGMIDK